MKNDPKEDEAETPEISRFLLKDTESLRNEIRFTELDDMVHPLTYTESSKKNSSLNLIPVMYKYQDGGLKERFLKLIEF